MCTTCAFEASKAVAASGGPGAFPVLLAAAATHLGLRALGDWILTQDTRWVTPRRLHPAASGAPS